MAWNFTDLRYGWKITTGIVLAGTTIYVANNTRWRVNQADVIELALGVHERCLATQTGTNKAGEPVYAVAPPVIVRSWYSNSYESTVTNGVTNWFAVLHTNIVTNAIGWRTDRQMMVDLDAKIFALIPYYVDTNSAYDGSSNISMLTVTGVFASLQIGDHTNQFTAIPAIGTNAATFGPWAWRNYIVAWQERYKVMNVMKMTKPNNSPMTAKYIPQPYGGLWESSWSLAKVAAEINFLAHNGTFDYFACYTAGIYYSSYAYVIMSCRINPPVLCTNLSCQLTALAMATTLGSEIYFTWDSYFITPPDDNTFDDNGLGVVLNEWKSIDLPFGLETNVVPVWCDEPTTNSPYYHERLRSGYDRWDRAEVRGFRISANHFILLADWQFNYCTEKYW